jgi:hypothetical protein
LNGAKNRSGQSVRMQGRLLERKYIVLMPGDEIGLPGSKTRKYGAYQVTSIFVGMHIGYSTA